MGTVPANFHGKKGRSGRKSASYERAKAETIEKAWGKVNREIEDSPAKDIALPIALKDMVAKVGNSDGSKLEAVLVKFIDEKPKETNSD